MGRPNILFLLIDCLRAEALLGEHRHCVTPVLDERIRCGVSFTQAISSASSTTPCVASILTGTYSVIHGLRSIFAHKLDPTVPTLPEMLQHHGYHTYAAVSGPLVPETGLHRGFATYHHREAAAYLSTSWGADLRGKLQRKEFASPYFLFLHLWELHHPRHILPPFRHRRYGRNRYERALSSLDAELGQLLGLLDDDPLVVIHSDHGERVVATEWQYRLYRFGRDLFGEWVRKREGHEIDVHEDLIRVPLIFCHSFLPAGKRIDQLVRQVDIFPTMLEWAGIDPPPGLQGRSLYPAILHDAPLHLTAYVEACGRVRSDPRDRRVGLRTREWKYIFAPHHPLGEELYHLASDPRERRNVAQRHPAVAQELRRKTEEISRGHVPREETVMSPEEGAAVEKLLRDLGYL